MTLYLEKGYIPVACCGRYHAVSAVLVFLLIRQLFESLEKVSFGKKKKKVPSEFI